LAQVRAGTGGVHIDEGNPSNCLGYGGFDGR
jgi:hypothetical protein